MTAPRPLSWPCGRDTSGLKIAVVSVVILLLTFIIGYALVNRFLTRFSILAVPAQQLQLRHGLFALGMAGLVGLPLSVWIFCLSTYCYQGQPQPFFGGTIQGVIILGLLAVKLRRAMSWRPLAQSFKNALSPPVDWAGWSFVAAVLVSGIFLFTFTMREADGNTFMGFQESDLLIHTVLVQSMVEGHNIPLHYPWFYLPHRQMNYHVLFYVMSAVLEYGGFSLAWAFNTLSVITYCVFFFILYGLAVELVPSGFIGLGTWAVILARSSFSVFPYLYDHLVAKARLKDFDGPTGFLKAIPGYHDIIGIYREEIWLQWCMPYIFTDQHHNLLGYAAVAFLFYFMMTTLHSSHPMEWRAHHFKRHLPLGELVFIGVLLGVLFSWNMTTSLIILVILTLQCLVVVEKLDLLIVLAIMSVLVFAQNRFFNGDPHLTAFTPVAQAGFGINNGVKDIVIYYLMSFGLFFPLVGYLFVTGHRRLKNYIVWATIPVVLATSVQWGVFKVNDAKLVVVSLLLLAIPVAGFLLGLLSKKKTLLAGVLLTLVMFLHTPFDWLQFINNNFPLLIPLHEEVTEWARKKTPPDAIFLTYTENVWYPFMFAGRKVFMHDAFGCETLGLDTNKRRQLINDILASRPKVEMRKRLLENHIDYIYMDENLRHNDWIQADEKVLDVYFPIVYAVPGQGIKIYGVSRKNASRLNAVTSHYNESQ